MQGGPIGHLITIVVVAVAVAVAAVVIIVALIIVVTSVAAAAIVCCCCCFTAAVAVAVSIAASVYCIMFSLVLRQPLYYTTYGTSHSPSLVASEKWRLEQVFSRLLSYFSLTTPKVYY